MIVYGSRAEVSGGKAMEFVCVKGNYLYILAYFHNGEIKSNCAVCFLISICALITTYDLFVG